MFKLKEIILSRLGLHKKTSKTLCFRGFCYNNSFTANVIKTLRRATCAHFPKRLDAAEFYRIKRKEYSNGGFRIFKGILETVCAA